MRLLAILVASVPISCAAASGPPRTAMAKVEALDSAEPIDAGTIRRLVDPSISCREGGVRLDCEYRNLALEGVTICHIDFRSTPKSHGSIVVLEKLRGDCVPVAMLETRFGPGALSPDCVDGPICFYQSYKRRWGRLSVALGNDPKTRCAFEIVLDSYREDNGEAR